MVTTARESALIHLNHVTSTRWEACRSRWENSPRGQVTNRHINSIRGDALNVLGYKTVQEFLNDNTGRIATVTFLAGAGTRWKGSVEAAQKRGEAKLFDPEKPRCLAPVEDLDRPGRTVPIGHYNLAAVGGIGTHFIVYSSHPDEIRSVAENAGLVGAKFFEQTKPENLELPLGHGDAMRQLLPELKDSFHFIITNFGGDPNSRETIITSLLVLAAMQEAEEEFRPCGIMPTAYFADPPFPIEIDSSGLPKHFMHKKLMEGASSSIDKGLPIQTNVGIRVYTREGLDASVFHFWNFFHKKIGYKIEGNSTNEFGLDNIDKFMAKLKRFRLLCIARPEEIIGRVKKFEDIEGFLASMRVVLGKEELEGGEE